MSSKAKGGITKGKSHAEGGIPMVVKSTGQKVELEGGEGVINKKNMADTQKHEFEGKMLTKCEIASEINSDGGNGVEIDCDGIVGKKYKHQDGGRLADGGDVKINEVTRFVSNQMMKLRPTESQLTQTMKWLSNNNYSNTGKMNERDGSFYIGVYIDKSEDKFVKLVEYLNSKSIKYGWLDDIEFKVGEEVGFDVPYFESFLEYRGKIISDKGSHLRIKYYEPLYDKMNITDVEYDRVYRLSKFEFGGLLNMKDRYFNWDVWLVRNEVYTKDILGDGNYKRATYPESKFYVYSKNGAKNLINTFKSKNIEPQIVIDESFKKRIEYKFESKDGYDYTIVIIEPIPLRKFVDSEDLGTLTNDYFTFERKTYAKGGEVDSILKRKIERLEEKIRGNENEYSDYYQRYGTSERQDMLDEIKRLKSRLGSTYAEGGEIPSSMRAIESLLKDRGFSHRKHYPNNELLHSSNKKMAVITDGEVAIKNYRIEGGNILKYESGEMFDSMQSLRNHLDNTQTYAKGGGVNEPDGDKIGFGTIPTYYTREEIDEIDEKFGADSQEYSAITLPKEFNWKDAIVIGVQDPFELERNGNELLEGKGIDSEKYGIAMHSKYGKNNKLIDFAIGYDDEGYYQLLYLYTRTPKTISETKEFRYAEGGDIDDFDKTWNRFKENTREAFGQPRNNNIVRLESDFGFKKSELPQLRTKDKPMFVKSLISKYGANVVTEGLKVKASQLKPIQNEINLEQVEVIANVSKGKMNPNKPITISQDGYVIDGHHRWYYAKENDLKLSVLQINLNAMQVIDEIWQSGLAKKEDISSVRKKQGGII